MEYTEYDHKFGRVREFSDGRKVYINPTEAALETGWNKYATSEHR